MGKLYFLRGVEEGGGRGRGGEGKRRRRKGRGRREGASPPKYFGLEPLLLLA